jgi:hypothetical protein
MTGYTYTTEQEAINARELCDNFYGYPIEGAVTSHWINYQFSELDNFYFIIFDESVRTLLGDPIEFDLTDLS